jgi:microcystin-dependent protein
MADPFLGEIRMFAGNFAPKGWALCDGQLLPIKENDALFSLLGTTYGGDGRVTFGLPDLRGRLTNHVGRGPGLTNRDMGQRTGSERVTLTANQVPTHDHPFMASSQEATDTGLNGKVLAKTPSSDLFYTPTETKAISLMPDSVQSVGDNQPHNNIMPYLCINFIIALVGTYPSRT